MKIVDEITIIFLAYELKHKKNVGLADLDDSLEKVHAKIRNSFITQIKDIITGGKYRTDVIRDVYLHSLKPDHEDVYSTLNDVDKWIVDKTLNENEIITREYWDEMLLYERNAVVGLIGGDWQLPPMLSRHTQDEILSKRESVQRKNTYNAHNMQHHF